MRVTFDFSVVQLRVLVNGELARTQCSDLHQEDRQRTEVPKLRVWGQGEARTPQFRAASKEAYFKIPLFACYWDQGLPSGSFSMSLPALAMKKKSIISTRVQAKKMRKGKLYICDCRLHIQSRIIAGNCPQSEACGLIWVWWDPASVEMGSRLSPSCFPWCKENLG